MSEYKALSAFEQVELQERIAYLETLVAREDEALKGVISIADRATQEFDAAKAAISASAETVQAFRDKLTEPLRREVAMLHKVVVEYATCTWPCEVDYGATEPRRSCCDTPPDASHASHCTVKQAIDNTQATAQAYEQKMKREGAVEALEDARNAASLIRRNYGGTGAKYAEEMLTDLLAERRATSKKAG